MTYAVVPDNATVQPRKFDSDWVDGGKPFTVYLGIRRFNPVGENVTTISGTESLSGVNTRFISPAATEEVRDLHESGPSAQVRRMKYALRILWETEKDFFGDYETIPIAQIERQGEEGLLSSSFFMRPVCAECIGRPGKDCEGDPRPDRLARIHSSRGSNATGAYIPPSRKPRHGLYLLALRSLNRSYPPALTPERIQRPPLVVYGLLRQLIGELSSFSEQYGVSGDAVDGSLEFPKYDHLNLWRCFSRAGSVITALLDEITAGPEYVFALNYDGTYYSSDLPPAVFEGRNRFYLMVATAEDAKTVLGALATGAKLSSRENLPILIVRALPGVGMTHLELTPQELPRRANAWYFQVDHNSEQFAGITKGRNIALFWESAPSDLKVELMVVGRG
jgi:type VI secretion system protein ImpJ